MKKQSERENVVQLIAEKVVTLLDRLDWKIYFSLPVFKGRIFKEKTAAV